MADVLRVYDPEECTPDGVPLDWEQCRACSPAVSDPKCGICRGHGSLKAAALAWVSAKETALGLLTTVRCQGCGHPQSDRMWGDRGDGQPLAPHQATAQLEYALGELRHGDEPDVWERLTYWSPCDDGCAHGGPVRHDGGESWHDPEDTAADIAALRRAEPETFIEAPWRQVDVRTLGWPHDLRPEKLSVLCLRCWAERSRGEHED